MLQSIPEMIVNGLILLVTFVALYRLGIRAKAASSRLEQDVLKLPLTNPEEIDDTHKSRVIQIRSKWRRETLLGGFSSVADFWMYCLIPTILLIDDFTSTILLGMYILFLLYLVSGFVTGIIQIVRKGSFWDAQIDPVIGIEADLERFVQKKLKERPQESSARRFYPEVDMKIRTNWEFAFQSALNQEIMHAIYIRELSSDDRQLLLEHLARREDIIGQIAREVQKDISLRELADH